MLLNVIWLGATLPNSVQRPAQVPILYNTSQACAQRILGCATKQPYLVKGGWQALLTFPNTRCSAPGCTNRPQTACNTTLLATAVRATYRALGGGEGGGRREDGRDGSSSGALDSSCCACSVASRKPLRASPSISHSWPCRIQLVGNHTA